MADSEINCEPVAQIVDGLLRSVFETVSEGNNVAVVDLENDSHLLKSDDDDVTVVNERKQSQQDDDEIEIVSAQITHPIRKPSNCLDADTINVDLLEDIDLLLPNPPPLPPNINGQQQAIDVDTLDNVEAIAAPPSLQPSVVPVGPPPSQREPVPDVVECVSSGATKPMHPDNLKCHSCDAALLKPRPLTRCKHLLCALCRIRAVTNMASKEKPIASQVRMLPVCVVPRCGAPLSNMESLEALAPDVADSAFQDSYQAFCSWAQTAPENEVTGAANVEFPCYAEAEPHMTSSQKDEDTFAASEDPDSLLEDDFDAAVNPLWVWDIEHVSNARGEGSWLCVACGTYEMPGQDAAPSAVPPPSEMTDNEPPDVPAHLTAPMQERSRSLSILSLSLRLKRNGLRLQSLSVRSAVHRRSPQNHERDIEVFPRSRQARDKRLGLRKALVTPVVEVLSGKGRAIRCFKRRIALTAK
ncbi:hypothetical protein FGB62_14g252 [Gracilaria domingensis]|nr:hypothetical protein FGB62_14g252 [Gracilaria domingensis]